jgi:hypothetical protein
LQIESTVSRPLRRYRLTAKYGNVGFAFRRPQRVAIQVMQEFAEDLEAVISAY